MTDPSTPNEVVITQYLAYRQASGRWRPGTVSVRDRQIHQMASWLEPVLLVNATEDDLLAWHRSIQWMQPESIAGYISAAHGIFKWMITRARPRLRTDDPTLILERPAIPRGIPRPMADRHYDLALACAVSEVELYVWLGLMGCSGFRCCEVAWMQTHDLETLPDGSGLAHIVGKGGKRRTVPIGQMLMLTMRPFLLTRGPVFTRPTDGKAYRPHGVSARINTFLRGLSIHETAHSLRHRFGTDYHGLDPDLYRQATIMGHASVDTTQRYTEISPVEAARYIEQMTSRRMAATSHMRVA